MRGVELVAPRAKGAGQDGGSLQGSGSGGAFRGWELPASTLPHHHGGSPKPGWALEGGSKQGLPAWEGAVGLGESWPQPPAPG